MRRVGVCASTSDVAAAWARSGAPDGAVVIADAQTGGRGRMGRVWHSPPGVNLYFSTVLRPALAPRHAPPLTLAAGVAVAEAVAASGGDVELKWPNDVLAGGKKVAGVLTEMATAGERIEFVVIGIGVNLNEREFPEELRERATSIALATGNEVDREGFVRVLCQRLEAWCDRLVDAGAAPIVARWKTFARLFGKTVTVDHGAGKVTGVAEDLDETGALLLRTPDGHPLRAISGELTLS